MLSWDKMNSVDLKVLGQSLKLNVSKGEEQYYKDIAKELNEMLEEFLQKSQLRSEIKAAISVAYKLLLDNKNLKEQLSCYDNFDSRIDDLISKLDI